MFDFSNIKYMVILLRELIFLLGVQALCGCKNVQQGAHCHHLSHQQEEFYSTLLSLIPNRVAMLCLINILCI